MGASKNAGMLRVIGGFKLAKALLLVAAAFGALSLAGHDVGGVLARVAEQLRIDPSSRLFQEVLGKLGQISPKLRTAGVGGLCYAGLFGVEGVGLLMGKRWAEWLTVIATGSLIPLEVFELVKRFTVIRLAVLLLNIAIVVYLVFRLKRERHG